MINADNDYRYRRSSHVVCFWREQAFVFFNYASSCWAGATPVACEVLEFFSDWRTLDDLHAARPDVDASTWTVFVSQLVEATLLLRSDDPEPEAEKRMMAFDRWNPEAGLFHALTKDVRFLDAHAARAAALDRAKTNPMPSPVKHYPHSPIVKLRAPSADCALEVTLLKRRTWRQFSKEAIDVDTLGRLLAFSAGVQEWAEIPGQGEVAFKTAPSGGARHPVEVYVLAANVAGLSTGLYHYSSDRHVLELLRADIGPKDVPRYFPHSEYFAECAAVLLFTAMYERDTWRYGYSRAYRAPLVEVGHLCQSFCLLATEYGLAPFVLMGLADSEIEKDLAIDGVSESVLYAAGVGKRPVTDQRAISEPVGFEPLRRRHNPFLVPSNS